MRGGELHNEEVYDLYSLPDIIRIMTKSRRVRWAGHLACQVYGEKGNEFTVFVGSLQERDYLEDLGVDWRND